MSEAERERATADGEPPDVLGEMGGEVGERAVAMTAFSPVRLGLPPPRCARCSSSDSVMGCCVGRGVGGPPAIAGGNGCGGDE
jgi:hypothetical protein